MVPAAANSGAAIEPPRDDYYGELAAHPDRARAVGWESGAAQAARFDVVRERVREGDRVLDLGAGLGDLGRHLAAHGCGVDYRGLERDPRLVARGRVLVPEVVIEHVDLFADDIGEAEVVAAIGVLIDGASLRSDAVRYGRLRRLIERARNAATRTAVIVVLDHDRLEAHPILSREPALGGIRRAEIAWLAPDAEVRSLLELDLALVITR